MAQTFVKRTISPKMPTDAMLAVAPLYIPEGASQTFKACSPLVFSSGYLVTASGTVESVEAFALEDGHNGSAGAYKVKVLPAVSGVHAYGNLLTTAAADNTLAATDLGAKVQLLYSATAGVGSTPIWYFGDSASTPCFKIVSFTPDPDHIIPNVSTIDAASGDTNARVFAVLLGSAADWNA